MERDEEVSDGPKHSTDDASSDDDSPFQDSIDDHGSIDLEVYCQK